MKIEHVALNVAEPVAMAQWYVEHLGLRAVVANAEPPYAHFLSDGAGAMLEIYRNDAEPVPDYPSMPPLRLHLAFESDDPKADSARLIAAGATHAEDVPLDDGGLIIILRDPWGLPFQLVRRCEPLG